METTAAIISALSVAPAISIVDKAIVSNASGREPLLQSLKSGIGFFFTNPAQFVKQRSFLLIWGVYSGTYIAANNVQGYCEREKMDSIHPKFIGSSVVNITLSVMKDRKFAKLFSAQNVPAPQKMSIKSLGLFAMRDSMTIFASFSVPPVLSKTMQEVVGVPKDVADVSSQLFSPCAMQFISTPLHLLGLDIYNNPSAAGGSNRFDFIRKEYVKTSLARVARILPAFGIGGVLNKDLRARGTSYVEVFNSKQYEMPQMDGKLITQCDTSKKK